SQTLTNGLIDERQSTQHTPFSTEAVVDVRNANANAYAAVSGHDFEEDVKDTESDWFTLKLGGINDGDEEDSKDYPPEVM
ncbi:MAG: hypothetical protein Q9164_005655, partial [Protoblastenia rupestris]